MSLDAEWRRLTRTSRVRRALKQWSIAYPARRGLADLDGLLERRRDDRAAPAVLRALAVLAPATIWPPGPCFRRCCPAWSAWPGSPATTTRPRSREIVSLTWERIRTYPAGRAVAANVLFDVRKRYRAHRLIDAPRSLDAEEIEAPATSRSPEDEARVLFEQLMAAQRDERVLRDGAFGLVLRTRLAGEPLTEVAERERLPLSCSPNAAAAPSAAYGNWPWPGDSSCPLGHVLCALRRAL